MFHKPLKEATKSLCQVYIIAYNWYRLLWWIFFIPCYNWKTYFFIQTHHYPEVWCNHNVTMLLTAMVTTYIKFYCINALNKIYLLVAFFPIFFQLVNVPHFFVNWILRLESKAAWRRVFESCAQIFMMWYLLLQIVSKKSEKNMEYLTLEFIKISLNLTRNRQTTQRVKKNKKLVFQNNW